MVQSCIVCEAPGAGACRRCRDAYYCSEKCQLKDLPLHELICGKFLSHALAPAKYARRPSKNHFRVIIFESGLYNYEGPKFVWLEFKHLHNRNDGREFWRPAIHEHLSLDPAEIPRHCVMNYNPLSKGNSWKLLEPVHICYTATPAEGGVWNSNICTPLSEMRGSLIMPRRRWYGPVIAYGTNQSSYQGLDCPRDLTTGDFRHIADFLNTYENTPRTDSIPRTELEMEREQKRTVTQLFFAASILVNSLLILVIACGVKRVCLVAQIACLVVGLAFLLVESLLFLGILPIAFGNWVALFVGLLMVCCVANNNYGYAAILGIGIAMAISVIVWLASIPRTRSDERVLRLRNPGLL